MHTLVASTGKKVAAWPSRWRDRLARPGMSNEHDSWFKSAFGVDLGEAVNKIKDAASAAVAAVEDAAPGSFPLHGSVGRKGKNAKGDVRAVQAALGLPADGQCGPQTIAAIEAYQRSLGQAKPDGRVDAGGATERAMAEEATAATWTDSAPQPTANPPPLAVGGEHVDSDGSSGGLQLEYREGAPEGDLVDALLAQQAALLTSLENASSDAEREQIREELEGVCTEISSELWTLKADEEIRKAESSVAQVRAAMERQLNPQNEQRYLTATGSFTQRQLDAQRISRGINAARMGVAAAGTLWATDDVGLAELVGTATGALGSLAKPMAPVTGRATVPPPPPRPSDPIAKQHPDLGSLPRSRMLSSATKPGRGGTSPIGTAIQSHADPKRPGDAFTSAGGNAKRNTEIGRQFLEDLFADPQTTVKLRSHTKSGEVIDVRRPDGAGATFTPKGDFLSLCGPYTPQAKEP